jgi:hypothetical protein
VCCPAAGNRIGAAGATALAAALQENTTVTALNLGGARACSGGRGGWRGRGTLGPTAAARRAGAPNVRGGREGEPLRGRAPRAALALPAASGPVRSRASFPCARASAWNRVALTWARGRGCAAWPQTTKSATPARQLLRPRFRRTQRSRVSTSDVRLSLLDGPWGVWRGWGPQRRLMCGEREREPLRGRAPRAALALRALGPARSCERRARASAFDSCDADQGSGSWVCCAQMTQFLIGKVKSAKPVRQLLRPRSRRTRRCCISVSSVSERARWPGGVEGSLVGPRRRGWPRRGA